MTEPTAKGHSAKENRRRASGSVRVLHVGPLPPPWTGMATSMENFLKSGPIGSQENWVVDTSRKVVPGAPQCGKPPTLRAVMRQAHLGLRAMSAVRQNRIQIVHFNGSSHDLSFLGNFLTILGVRLAGARVIWHLHDDLEVVSFPGRKWLPRAVFRVLMHGTDSVAVMTEKDKRIATALVSPSRIKVIPPVSSPEMSTVPLERNEDKEIRALFVGWLTAAKGIYDLLEVALRTRESRPPIVFHVLGTGMSNTETDAVHRFVEEHRLQSRVKICGVLTGEQKRRTFAQAHLFFLPTHWDAFPVVVLEAMSAGLPVLGSKVGGLPYMCENGQGGFLIDVGDIDQLTKRLLELARDPALRLAMGKANRARFMERFHPDKVGQTALDLYTGLLENDGGTH